MLLLTSLPCAFAKRSRCAGIAATSDEAAPTVEAKCAQRAVQLLSAYLAGCYSLSTKDSAVHGFSQPETVKSSASTRPSVCQSPNGCKTGTPAASAESAVNAGGMQQESNLTDAAQPHHTPQPLHPAMPTMNGNAFQAMPNSDGTDAVQAPASMSQDATPGHSGRSADNGTRGHEMGLVTGTRPSGQPCAEPALLLNSSNTELVLSNGHKSADAQRAHRPEPASSSSSNTISSAEAQSSCLTASGQLCAAMWSAACDQHFLQVMSSKQDLCSTSK